MGDLPAIGISRRVGGRATGRYQVSDIYQPGFLIFILLEWALSDPFYHLDGATTWRNRLRFGLRAENFAGSPPGVWRWKNPRWSPRRNSDAGIEGSAKPALNGSFGE